MGEGKTYNFRRRQDTRTLSGKRVLFDFLFISTFSDHESFPLLGVPLTFFSLLISGNFFLTLQINALIIAEKVTFSSTFELEEIRNNCDESLP